MPRIEKTEAKRGAIVALILFASSVLAGCTTDPSPRTYLDWNVRDERAVAAREAPAPTHRANWPGATYYTVVARPNDTVARVAARYDVSESSVRRLNDIGPHDPIHAGDVLRIPPGPGSTRESVLREVGSPRIYAQPHDADYVEEHPLAPPSASAAPVRVARAAPAPHIVAVPSHVEDTSSEPPSGDMHFVWPVSGGHVVSGFGTSADGQRNDGMDIAASEGAPVRAAAAGTVTYAGNELRQYGNLVIIKHADGYITVYAHQASIGVKKGDQVAQGQTIGTAGTTGGAVQPGVHFEVRYDTKPVNPRPLLSETVARASS